MPSIEDLGQIDHVITLTRAGLYYDAAADGLGRDAKCLTALARS